MRKSKIIDIDGVGEVTVKEVSPYALYQAINGKDKVGELRAIAVDCVAMPSGKQLEKLWPSEVEQVVDAFMEVNESFLALAGKLGIKNMLIDMMMTVVETLPQLFADSYKQVMESLPGTTAGAVS